MGLLDKIKDNFTKAEFTVSPQKKLKTLSAEFETAFGAELVFYKGKQIADGALTLKQLNDKTTKTVDTRAAEGLKIKGSMKVGDAENWIALVLTDDNLNIIAVNCCNNAV